MNAPLLRPTPDWAEHERPALPGSASMPAHRPAERVAYAAVAVLAGLTGGLGTALMTANLPALQGALGLQPAEAAWLSAAYAMTNVTANMVLFKFRQQFGLRLFAEIGLGAYAALALLHLLADTPQTLLLLRAASGFAGAAASSLAILYMLQAFPRARIGQALVLGLGIASLAAPLAWLLSPSLLDLGQWHRLAAFEAGLALLAFAAVVSLKLPPGIHIRAFEPLDFLTFALVAPAVALLVGAAVQGPLRWWTDAPWIGAMLALAAALLAAAFAVEHHRRNPLLRTRWLLQPATLAFLAGALLLRLLTTEQSYGVVTLLRTLGMGGEQMQPLFAVVLAGTLAGLLLCAATFGPRSAPWQLAASVALFALAGWLDTGHTSLDRPLDFAASQFLLSMGLGMFVGPLVMTGIQQALKRGPDHIVTFIVAFALTQTFGGLLGNAALSTWQQHREHVHSAALTAQLAPTDPRTAERLRALGAGLAPTVTDPAQRQALAAARLAADTRREAQVRAFDDVFALTGALAASALSIAFLLALARRVHRAVARAAPTGAPRGAP